MPDIVPSIGRVVWFRSNRADLVGREAIEHPALITRVHSNTCVNLHVLPDMLPAFPIASVQLIREGELVKGESGWRWMPYQQQVAGKTEQLLAAGEKLARKPDDTLAAQDAQAAAVAKTPNRITLEHIEAQVIGEQFLRAGPGDLLTVCVLTLRNGFTVTGESAAADPANFNEELGRLIARRHAIEKIWPLEGYQLRTRLAAMGSSTPAAEAQANG